MQIAPEQAIPVTDREHRRQDRQEPAVVARAAGVSKSFGGVHALAGVDLEIHAGEVHALCGENGAGKSTLIKILAGFLEPDEGTVTVAARAAGDDADGHAVGVIHQESVACPDLDAVDNVFVGREQRWLGGLLLDRGAMERQTRELLARLGETIRVDRPIGELPLAQRQMIGIARALSERHRLLIMDEPTASLSARETEVLFRIIRQLREQGVAVLYVSHRLEEIFDLADRVTVLRDGRHVRTCGIDEVTPQSLVGLMVGRDIQPLEGGDSARPRGGRALEVASLTRAPSFHDVSLTVDEGEVVGLAGLVGAGRSELADAIFGITEYDHGAVRLHGQELPGGDVAASIRQELAYVPEDRQHLGLVLPMSITANLSLAVLRSLSRWGLVSRPRERALATRLAADLQVRAARLSLPAESLSGGNQQKLVLGKWLASTPRVLILDEPTRGIDVAAKSEIHRRIRELAGQGMAVLLISSELPEVLRLSDRILVMRQGRIAGELSRDEATEEGILELALPSGGNVQPGRSQAATEVQAARRAWSGAWQRRETWLAMLLLATLILIGGFKPSFLAPANLLDIASDAAPTAIIACAVALVVVTGEIDISVGSLVGLSAALLGIFSYGPSPLMPTAAGVACVLLIATGVGATSGLLVTLGRVPSIVATLAMLTVLRGITKLVMQGNSIQGRPEALRELATGKAGGVPYSVLLAIAAAVATAVLARRTPLGRRIYAVGSNVKAAPLLGVSAARVKLAVFTLAGLASGVAAVLITPRNSVIQPNVGESLELLVVTCVVVGGVSIQGGRGTIWGVMLAVFILSMVPTALTFVGAPPQWRLAIQGAFILAAVLADQLAHRRQSQGGAR